MKWKYDCLIIYLHPVWNLDQLCVQLYEPIFWWIIQSKNLPLYDIIYLPSVIHHKHISKEYITGKSEEKSP